MKILGLRHVGGIPIMEMLCIYYNNSTNKNNIEIARDYFNVEPKRYKAILLVWDNDMSIYTADNFK